MSTTAAERIVIDDALLSAQLTSLRSALDRFEQATTSASNKISDDGFGALNGFLAEAMNEVASLANEAVLQAAALTVRIHEGVSAGRNSFTEFENEAKLGFREPAR